MLLFVFCLGLLKAVNILRYLSCEPIVTVLQMQQLKRCGFWNRLYIESARLKESEKKPYYKTKKHTNAASPIATVYANLPQEWKERSAGDDIEFMHGCSVAAKMRSPCDIHPLERYRNLTGSFSYDHYYRY